MDVKDQTLQVWDIASNRIERTFKDFKKPTATYWSPSGELLLAFDSAQTASVWSLQTGMKVCELIRVPRDIREVIWSEDGKTIMFTTRNDGLKAIWLEKEKIEAHLWDAETGRYKFSLEIKGLNAVTQFSPDGRRILTAGEKDDAKLWDTQTGKLLATLHAGQRSIYQGASALFSPNGQVIVVTRHGYGIYLWNASTGKLLAQLTEEEFGEHHYAVRGFSPDGKMLVIYHEHLKGLAKTESSVEVRDGRTGELGLTLKGRNMMEATHQIVWNSVSQTLISGGGSKKYEGKIWDLTTGQMKATFPMVAHPGRMPFTSYYADLDRLSFHPKLSIVMAVSNNFIRLWNSDDGELLQRLEGVTAPANWSAEGRFLLATTKDRKSIQIWELV